MQWAHDRYRSPVAAVRVILVSDTHLSPAAPEAGENWEAVLRHIGAVAPDVVIHLGDLTLDGAHNPADLGYGRQQLERLPAAWHVIPGNHDVGDNPWPGAPKGAVVNAERRRRWLESVGSDWWSLSVSGGTLLGINPTVLGAGVARQGGQGSRGARRQDGRPVHRHVLARGAGGAARVAAVPVPAPAGA